MYGAATLLSIGYLVSKRESLAVAARWSMGFGAGLHFLSLAFHCSFIQDIFPGIQCSVWPKRFTSLSFFALLIAVEYLIVQAIEHLPILGAFVTPFVVGFMAAALSIPPGFVSKPILPPELEASWLMIHVPLIFVAYGAFAIAFSVGLAYLIQERQLKSKKPSHLAFRLPSLDELDNLIFRIVIFGWPVLVLGVGLGHAWALQAWGEYTKLDPKLVWALITVLVYGIYLFLRIFFGWRGRRITYVSLLGFVLVLASYLCVNHLTKV